MLTNFYLLALALIGCIALVRLAYSYRYWFGWQFNNLFAHFRRAPQKQRSDHDTFYM
ncbi:MAG: hypothetical protein JXK05_00060 [Campylobacterales bacterium]|nr:hypothetical protein [Campylobacterales bacterium]